MGWTAASLAVAAIGTGASIAQGEASAKATKKFQAAQLAASAPKPKTQDAVNASGTRDANATAALAGIPGTLLTGAKGVDPNSLNTGKTLLGG